MMEPGECCEGVQLGELLKGVTSLALAGNTLVDGVIGMVTCDSREVLPGSLFVAIKGYCDDGSRFINSAIERGAAAVICEEFPSILISSCLYIKVSDAAPKWVLKEQKGDT